MGKEKKDNSEFENNKWGLYAEMFTELRHKKDEIDMIKDLLGRLSDNKTITTTDINLINKVMNGSLALKLLKISTSPRYLKAMSINRKQKTK